MSKDGNRSTVSLFLPLAFGLLLGLVILYHKAYLIENNMKPEDFALGQETSSYWGKFLGRAIQCSTPNDSDDCIAAYSDNDSDKDLVLWLGNSQLHGINQMKTNDINAVELLHRSLRGDGQYVMGLSYPNVSLQQNYVTFEYVRYKLPITTLILPVVFDDFRETGVGSQFSHAFDMPAVVKSLNYTEIGHSLVDEYVEQHTDDSDMPALNETVQEVSEKFLNNIAKDNWKIWEKRSELKANLLGDLYFFRNWLFGINASSIRNIIPGRYQQNFEAYRAILQSAKQHDIKVLTYIVPLRNDVARPYNKQDYLSFKDEVLLMAKNNNAHFADLEDLVPSQEWGMKSNTGLGQKPEIDFMHFQFMGHQRLAEAIKRKLAFFKRDVSSDF